MHTKDYKVEISISLEPIWHEDPPEIILRAGPHHRVLYLKEPSTIEFEYCCQDRSSISVELVNKKDSDTRPELGLDKAVVVKSVAFFGITDPKFVWNGIYRPVYPQAWASQQKQPLPAELSSHDYICWNGVWQLDFTVPVFTWMHRVMDHGWVYD
jgi:hypothetical protein